MNSDKHSRCTDCEVFVAVFVFKRVAGDFMNSEISNDHMQMYHMYYSTGGIVDCFLF